MTQEEIKESLANVQELIETSHFEEAKTVAFDLLTQINANSDNNIISKIYSKIGVIFYYLSDYSLSIEYFSKAISFYEELGNRKELATTFVDRKSVV